MKRIPFHLTLILLLLTLCLPLASCSRPAYIPEGEVYAKTSPANGDAGVREVVDMEITHASYTAEGEVTIPVKLGVGHHPSDVPDGEGYAYLIILARYDTTPPGEYLELGRLDYPDFETAKYNSTEPEPDRSFLVIPIYGEFYPIHRESWDWTIPADATSGRIEAELHIIDEYGNEYKTRRPTISFERVDGKVLLAGD